MSLHLLFHLHSDVCIFPHSCPQDLSTRRLSGGARIRAVFNEVYSRAIAEMAPMKDVSDDAILTVIKNGAGVAGVCVCAPAHTFELYYMPLWLAHARAHLSDTPTLTQVTHPHCAEQKNPFSASLVFLTPSLS